MKLVSPLTPDEHDRLASLDATEPFASLDIDAALAVYNDADPESPHSIKRIGTATSSLLNEWAAEYGIYPALYTAASDPQHPTFGLAKAAVNAFENTAEPLDLSKSKIQGMLSQLVTAGIVPSDPDASAALYAAVTTYLSPAQSIGFQVMRRSYLEAVRGLI